MNKIIEDLNWRYATKKYDTTKKISAEDFNIIKESLRLSPSSFGLQPLRYFVVKNNRAKNPNFKNIFFGIENLMSTQKLLI